MKRIQYPKRKNIRAHLWLIVLTFLVTGTFAGDLGLRPPEQPPGVVSLFKPTYPGLSRFFHDSTLFESTFRHSRRVVELDTATLHIQIRELLFDRDYLLPISMDLEYYVHKKLEHDNQENLRKVILKGLNVTERSTSSGIELNIPVKIKSKAFKRIFGGDRVGLRVTGNISFELAGRAEKRSGSAVSRFEQKGNFSPRFKQTQQFQVEGRVGDKVSVKVDQNSEATFDLENTLRLTYTGDEDEIIQKIEAGNVSLSLPSTNYVSATTKHKGLFGLKTEMQLGNLSFTGIASLQRGEKQKITQTGQAAKHSVRVRDIDYVRNRFFFVDDIYQENFEKAYDPETMQWVLFDEGKKIVRLDVWRSSRPTDQETRPGWALVNPDTVGPENIDKLIDVEGEVKFAYFVRLKYPEDYNYDEYRGFFWLNQNLQEQDILAIAYQTEDGTTRGMLVGDIADSTTIVLKMIKPQALKPEYPTWKLVMRNVYNLGSSSIPEEGFDVNILYTKTGENVDVQPVPPQLSFNYLMGLDRLDQQGNPIEGGDKQIDVNNGNIFDRANGYLIFPSLTPFAPPRGSPFAIDSSLYVKIYNAKDYTLEQREHKFDIEITTSTSSSTYNLGFNVLEGSEVVRLNGRELVRDKDYIIDYFSGTLQILDEEARRPNANVEIEYERGSLFQLDKKTLLGGRLEYSLGERGFIGMTALYLNRSTLDQRVRLGQEPVRNFIWDVNTALDFRPNFLSKALDKLPVVETAAESKLHVEAEYAEVSPNPNTFNEDKLGEKGGVAYIDDFEGSKRSTTLGIPYLTWSRASVPAKFVIPSLGVNFDIPISNDSLMYAMDDNRVWMFWYNPFDQVPIKDIWPNKDVNAQTGYGTNVLVLAWKNDSIPQDRAWGGIMRSTVSFPDQKKTKYIELWIKGDIGQVNIDIGRISEDFYIRKNTFAIQGRASLRNLNTEDRNLNGLLDEGEDIGLDGIPYGQPNADPLDVWKDPLSTVPNFLYINGTEGNGERMGAKYPDTEDLDGDGGLNLTNSYFSYQFDLSDPSNPYITGSTEKGWRQYRIPIRAYDPNLVVGNPDTTFQDIRFVRLWVNNLPPDGKYHLIQIATFDFVGNEWEETGVAQDENSPFVKSDSLFTLDVYNDEENSVAIPGGPEPYHSPPNVTGIVDRITRAKSKEQSLVLRLNHLEPGAIAEANKQLPEKMNLINYARLKMFVHGDWQLPDGNLPDAKSPLQFFIRFGPTEEIYYEIGGPVFAHWHERNNIDVLLDELAKTKRDEFLVDSLNGQPVYYRQDPEHPEKYFKVVGKPNLRNINFMIMGARNVGDFPIEGMEIWIDELRVTDVERDKGSAMRLRADLTLADVGSFRAQWEVTDANFRRIEDQYGSGMNNERQSYRFSLKLNKFFPESWGLQIPVSGGLQYNKQIPKYYFNTDQLTKYSGGSFGEKIKRLFGLNTLDPELEKNSRISQSKSLGFTFQRRSSPKAPWYLKYTIDLLRLDVDWSQRHSSDERNLLNDVNALSGSLQLNLPFGRNNFFRPFGWLGNGPIVRALASQKFYYTPNSIQAGISINDNESKRQARLEAKPTTRITTTSSRKLSMSYTMFPSLGINFSRNYQSDAQLKGYRAPELIDAIFSNFDFGVDKLMSQRFGVNYGPKISSWLSPKFTYNSNFTYNFRNVKTNEKTSSLRVDKKLSLNIRPKELVNKIYNPLRQKVLKRGKSVSNRNRGRPGRTQTGKSGQSQGHGIPGVPQKEIKGGQPASGGGKTESGQDSTGGKKKSRVPPIKIPNPLMLVWHFFDSWRTINFDYQVTDNYQHFNIDRMPTLNYMFGFTTDPGVGVDTTFNKIPRLPAIKNSKNIAASMDFDFMKNLTTSFSYNFRKDMAQNNQQKTESVTSSYFFLGDDPEKFSWSMFIPDWRIRLSGLEKFPMFRKFARTITIDHSRSGKFNEFNRYDDNVKSRDSWSYTMNYQPFLGINLNTKWGVNGTIRYTKSINFNYSATGAAKKSTRSGFDMNFTYTKRGGLKLPIPFLKRKKLRNEMTFTLAFNVSSDLILAKRPGSDSFEEEAKNKSWKIKPSVNYRFSQKVNGAMFIEKAVTETKLTGTTSYFEFGINVNIAIR